MLDTQALTVSGTTLGEVLDSMGELRTPEALPGTAARQDGIPHDAVIMSPAQAQSRGLTSTFTFPRGNLAPEGAVIKSTAIDPTVVDANGIYRKEGPARVFVTRTGSHRRHQGRACSLRGCAGSDGRGPAGHRDGRDLPTDLSSETSSVRQTVALVTDARFSGVSTGACIGHVWAGSARRAGPIGKLRDGDWIRIVIDRVRLEGTVDFVGESQKIVSPEEGARILARRPPHADLKPNPALPDDTRLWAALQQLGGGTWGGCVYDVDSILAGLTTAQRPPL